MGKIKLISYTIQKGDTLQKIAKEYLLDSSLWLDIVHFNKLDYPYVVDIDKEAYATGYIFVYRTPGNVSDITIPTGTIVTTEDSGDGVIKRYMVDKDYTFVGDTGVIEIGIRSVDTRLQGNVKKQQIKILEVPITGISSIINLEDVKVFNDNIRASGEVTFYRTEGSIGDIIIPYGTRVSTTYNINTDMALRYFYTTDSFTLLDGNTSIDASVICTRYGDFGNVQPGKIDSLIDDISSDILRIENKSVFNNGSIIILKRPGDVIYIPQTGVDNSTTTDPDIKIDDMYDLLLGEDILLNNDGDFEVDIKGDIKSIKGVDNLSQAIRGILKSTRGSSLLYHPEYGTLLYEYIGDTVTEEELQLIKEEIIRTVLYDPRIEGVPNIGLAFQKGLLAIDMDITVIGSDNIKNIQFYLKGGK